MLNAYGGGDGPSPPIPPRGISSSVGNGRIDGIKNEKSSVANVRESIGILFVFVISVLVLLSSVFIFKYALRDRSVYEELVDYLDKTVSISKINFNPVLGVYELKPLELEGLDEHRKYKSFLWAFLFADLASLLLFGIAAFFYFSVETSRGIIRVLFWFFFIAGLIYALVEVSVFTFLLSPYMSKLPNATTALLDHAIPYNPGGLGQMEHSFGCIFDQNLYETFKRHTNPRNTCDPFLQASFFPKFLLILFVVLRLLAVFLFLTLISVPRSALTLALVRCIMRVKPTIKYKKNVDGPSFTKKLPPYYSTSSHGSTSKTTFGVKENVAISSPMPPGSTTHQQLPPMTPPIGQIDHRINYNNAALFAVSGVVPSYSYNVAGSSGPVGVVGCGSSRSSEISIAKCAGIGGTVSPTDLLKKQLSLSHLGSTHTTNSLVSEV